MSHSSDQNSTPPQGDYQKAEKYITQLTQLIREHKLEVTRTDLNKFDPGSFQDHYRIDLKDYQIEISHSKLADSGKDSYVMLFTNFKNIADGSCSSVIMGYIHLTDSQYHRFRSISEEQLQEKKRLEEETRFKEALNPLDVLLQDMEAAPSPKHEETHTLHPIMSEPEPQKVEERSFWEEPQDKLPLTSDDSDFTFISPVHQS